MNKVLEVRLDTLLAALDEVKKVVEFWENRQRERRELTKAISAVELHLKTASRSFRASVVALKLTDTDLEPAEADLARVKKALDLMTAQLDEASATAAKFEDRLNRISKVKLRWTMSEDLVRKASRLSDRVAGLKAKAAAAASANADGAIAADSGLDDIWKELTGEIEVESSDLFEVFNDILGGVALRVTGLDGLALRPHRHDRSISWLAEELATHQWRGVTLPTSSGLAAEVQTSVVHLGFPEWTIWDLPYAAQSWASAAAGGICTQVSRKAASELGVPRLTHLTRAELNTVVVDAMATYLMGPSYACATFLLHLNPLLHVEAGGDDEADGDGAQGAAKNAVSRSDHARAWTIHETLVRLSAEAPVGSFTFKPIAASLQEAWLQASSGEANEVSDETGTELRAVVEALITHMDSPASTFMRYELDRWSAVTRWCESVRLDQPPEVESLDLRDVLNFAWQCRMEGCLKAPVDIERKALELWEPDPAVASEEAEPASRRSDQGAQPMERI